MSMMPTVRRLLICCWLCEPASWVASSEGRGRSQCLSASCHGGARLLTPGVIEAAQDKVDPDPRVHACGVAVATGDTQVSGGGLP